MKFIWDAKVLRNTQQIYEEGAYTEVTVPAGGKVVGLSMRGTRPDVVQFTYEDFKTLFTLSPGVRDSYLKTLATTLARKQ